MPILYETLPSGIARIVLNRAETRNAQDTAFLYALNDAFDRAAQDDAIKVIVLSANGPHFSSGHDLREVDGHGNMRKHETVGTWSGFGKPGAEAQYAREQEIYLGFCERWRNIPKPTMALVQGKVIAGGLMLIWPCDLIVASEDAEFLDHTVAMGVGGAEFFAHPWELGVRKAKEFLFTADWIGAAEAHRLGMVNHVVPRAELEAFGLAMAERIAQKPLFALKLTKQAINAAQDAQGRVSAMQTSFALHHLAHAHNMLAHGKLVDPTGLMPAIKKHQKGVAEEPGAATPVARHFGAQGKIAPLERRAPSGIFRAHERQEHRPQEHRHRRRHRRGRSGNPPRPRATELPGRFPEAARLGPLGRQDARVQGQALYGRGAESVRLQGRRHRLLLGRRHAQPRVRAGRQGGGRVVVDNTSAFRMEPDMPLVVPEVNGGDLAKHNGVIANPNCTAVIMSVAVWPMHQAAGVKRVIVWTYQSASGAGAAAMHELEDQARDFSAGKEIKRAVFPHQIAFNVFSHNTKVAENGYNEEENKMVEETRKMFHLPEAADRPDLHPRAGAARAQRGDQARAREAAVARRGARHPGQGAGREGGRRCRRQPLPDAARGQRRSRRPCRPHPPRPLQPQRPDAVVAGDQLLKGAAWNAVQIAEELAKLSAKPKRWQRSKSVSQRIELVQAGRRVGRPTW